MVKKVTEWAWLLSLNYTCVWTGSTGLTKGKTWSGMFLTAIKLHTEIPKDTQKFSYGDRTEN